MIRPASEFNEFKPRLKSPNNRFQLNAGLNLKNISQFRKKNFYIKNYNNGYIFSEKTKLGFNVEIILKITLSIPLSGLILNLLDKISDKLLLLPYCIQLLLQAYFYSITYTVSTSPSLPSSDIDNCIRQMYICIFNYLDICQVFLRLFVSNTLQIAEPIKSQWPKGRVMATGQSS